MKKFLKENREFKDKICPYCTNKDTNLCEIHTMIDGGLKCPYYNKDITKFKRKEKKII